MARGLLAPVSNLSARQVLETLAEQVGVAEQQGQTAHNRAQAADQQRLTPGNSHASSTRMAKAARSRKARLGVGKLSVDLWVIRSGAEVMVSLC